MANLVYQPMKQDTDYSLFIYFYNSAYLFQFAYEIFSENLILNLFLFFEASFLKLTLHLRDFDNEIHVYNTFETNCNTAQNVSELTRQFKI